MRLSVVATVGDKLPDTEEEPDGLRARWVQMGGWVAPTQAAQAGTLALRQDKSKEHTAQQVILDFTLVSLHVTLWQGHQYACGVCESIHMFILLVSLLLHTSPTRATESNKYNLWFILLVKKSAHFTSWNNSWSLVYSLCLYMSTHL